MPSDRFNFTKASIEALPLPATGERATYHDLQTSGLQLRVSASGKKTFSLYKRAKGGKPERVTLGSFNDGVTVEQARTKALKLKSAMSDGTSPAMVMRAKRAELTFGEAFDMYIRDHATPAGLKSIDRMRGDFERYLGTMPKVPKKKHGKEREKSPGSVNWQDRKLSSITQRDIKDLRAALAKECGNAAANHALKLVRVVFNKMCEWGEYKGENPALNPGLLKVASRDRFLRKEELPSLFDTLAATTNTNSRDFIMLSILTGARRSNVMAMRWTDISFERAEWRIPDTKNGDPVIIQLSREAVETLRTRQASIPAGDWVFPGRGKSGHMESPKKGVSTILKTARIEKLTIHDLRRTLGSWQAITGASLPIIGKSLGHKSIAATQIYARLSADPVRESVQRATGAIFEAATMKEKQINKQ
nr:site-specific integrase [uncultured Duganella sp.]